MQYLDIRLKSFFVYILIVANPINLLAQIDSNTVYRNLEVKKFYSVDIGTSSVGNNTTYKVNNKRVSKSTYDKYHSTWEDMSSCCPCILTTYDENDVLISEAVSCTDCRVGYFKEFYPNGNLKIQGQFMENPTNNWIDIYKRGYCNVPDGKWLYYNNKGQIYAIEIWDKGEFIKQRPEGKEVDIWKVELLLNGVSLDTQKVALEDFNKLVILPKFKNSNKDVELKIKLRISAVGFKVVEKQITLEELKNIDIQDLIKEVGTSATEKLNAQIGVYHKGTNIWNFFVKLK